MTDETLEKGNLLKQRIKNLDNFIRALNRQKLSITTKTRRMFLKALPYGLLSEEELICSDELANRIYEVVKDYREELVSEYKSLT